MDCGDSITAMLGRVDAFEDGALAPAEIDKSTHDLAGRDAAVKLRSERLRFEILYVAVDDACPVPRPAR